MCPKSVKIFLHIGDWCAIMEMQNAECEGSPMQKWLQRFFLCDVKPNADEVITVEDVAGKTVLVRLAGEIPGIEMGISRQ